MRRPKNPLGHGFPVSVSVHSNPNGSLYDRPLFGEAALYSWRNMTAARRTRRAAVAFLHRVAVERLRRCASRARASAIRSVSMMPLDQPALGMRAEA